jgi:hypothetical protein
MVGEKKKSSFTTLSELLIINLYFSYMWEREKKQQKKIHHVLILSLSLSLLLPLFGSVLFQICYEPNHRPI